MQAEAEAPSKIYANTFSSGNSVFYGTDDGHQDGSFGEFEEFETFFNELPDRRKHNIHYASAIGGLYGLNLIPLLKPTEISFFDINPHAVSYFKLIRQVLITSNSKQQFLDRLSNQDFDVATPDEEIIRENIAMKQRDELPRERGSSKRSFEASWRYALDRYDLTKSLLKDSPVNIMTDGMQSETFENFVRDKRDFWLYASNIFEFVYINLEFTKPVNVVALSIIYPGQSDLLDLDPLSKYPVQLKGEIPMQVHRVREFELIIP